MSLSCTAEGDNSLLPVSKPPVKHKPHLRNSVMTFPPPFFFLLQLCTQTCKNYRQLTRPSTPGVFRRSNTVIISQQKYLFQSPYLQKKQTKKHKATTLKIPSLRLSDFTTDALILFNVNESQRMRSGAALFLGYFSL